MSSLHVQTKKAVMKWGDEELEALPVSMRTHVSKDRHGRVNGKGGKKRREIEEEFGVRIIIPSVADEDDVIRIEGKDNHSVDQALRQVLAAASARDPSQRNVRASCPQSCVLLCLPACSRRRAAGAAEEEIWSGEGEQFHA